MTDMANFGFVEDVRRARAEAARAQEAMAEAEAAEKAETEPVD
jgi:hypothetical protein